MKSLLKDKQARAKEITLGGAIILIIMGIILLTQSGSDPSGVIAWMGGIFLLVGIVALIAILISFFK